LARPKNNRQCPSLKKYLASAPNRFGPTWSAARSTPDFERLLIRTNRSSCMDHPNRARQHWSRNICHTPDLPTAQNQPLLCHALRLEGRTALLPPWMPAYSGPPWRCSPATTLFYRFRCGALSTAPTPNWTYSFTKLFPFQRPSEKLDTFRKKSLTSDSQSVIFRVEVLDAEVIIFHGSQGRRKLFDFGTFRGVGLFIAYFCWRV
jgi:hypothetical protein